MKFQCQFGGKGKMRAMFRIEATSEPSDCKRFQRPPRLVDRHEHYNRLEHTSSKGLHDYDGVYRVTRKERPTRYTALLVLDDGVFITRNNGAFT